MKLAIIGAGPAGIFATKFLKNWNGEIHLFEANQHIGKKLSLTGGGRMNLTNKNLNVEHYFSENERALKHIFKSNFARNYLDLFDELGIKMKWEKNRALLQSEDGAGQVLKWEQEFEHQKNLSLHLNCEISNIKKVGAKFSVTDNKSITHLFDILLITSGGMFRLLAHKNEQEIYSQAITLEKMEIKKISASYEIKKNLMDKKNSIKYSVKISWEENNEKKQTEIYKKINVE